MTVDINGQLKIILNYINKEMINDYCDRSTVSHCLNISVRVYNKLCLSKYFSKCM